jgi:hypothetical protein
VGSGGGSRRRRWRTREIALGSSGAAAPTHTVVAKIAEADKGPRASKMEGRRAWNIKGTGGRWRGG